MKIRTKLAALTLAAGTIIGGGAALSMGGAAEAKPVIGGPNITLNTIPPFTVQTIGPVKDICKLFPHLCPKPTTTSTAKPNGSTTSTAKPNETTTSTAKPTDTTKPVVVVQAADPVVVVRPAFTG